MDDREPLTASVESIRPPDFDAHAAEWRSVEARAPAAAPFLTHDWLRRWVEVYAPSRLAVLRVTDERGDIAGLALLHQHLPRIWRFAGAPVSPERALLCPEQRRDSAWAALGRWLRENPRDWAMLDAQGVAVSPNHLPGARRATVPVLALDLPASYEEYVDERSQSFRAKTRKRLRRFERSTGAMRMVEAADLAGALRDLVRLHGLRAESKGERHPEVDGRLARLLELVAASDALRVRAFEMVVDGQRAGITVRIDRGSAAYSYNDGLDPAHMSLSPGILLELESIRDALEDGITRYDLGPGDYPYKRELGALPEERHSVRVVIPGMRGRMAVGVITLYRGVHATMQRTAVRFRSSRHGALALGLCEPLLAA
jgi:CelD/BcsL family acetyltransferase involved in cellulose biosynthesis